MLKFCRNCGKALAESSSTACPFCHSHPVKSAAFCRYCGHPTNIENSICANCGSSIKPLPASARIFSEKAQKLIKAGKVVNLSIVFTGLAVYGILVLPPKLTKSIQTVAGDAVMASTGYTALPVRNIASVPNGVPPLHFREGAQFATAIATNATRQLTIYAVRTNISDNGTKATRLDDVTANCTFKSSNENIATVNASGFVQVRSAGQANITATYIGPPGSSNLSNAATGKIPTIFTVDVLVNAAAGGIQ